jgi:imidazolonepropionase-like amidohydrolase
VDLAIVDVTIVDVRSGELRFDRTVRVRGNRIVSISRTDDDELPPETEVVEGAGKFLMPGLWDMHTHAIWHDHGPRPNDQSGHFGLFIANGVTGIRDMAGHADTTRALRHRIERGDTIGPRIIVPGDIVDGPSPIWSGTLAADSPARGELIVDSLASAGVDFVKIYSQLPRDVFFAVLERAAELGIPVSGHVPHSVTAFEASEAGLRSMEHLRDFELDCSSSEAELRALPWGHATRELAIQSFDPARCTQLARTLARNETWQTPTRVVRWFHRSARPTLDSIPGAHYASPTVRRAWAVRVAALSTRPDSLIAEAREAYRWRNALTAMLRDEGVMFLAGSDMDSDGSNLVVAGFGLHEELRTLVEAGLTNLEALQAATLNPALYLDASDSLGTVEEGRVADLVLLDANPLEDIRNTTRINAVMANGRLFYEDELQGLKDAVLSQNYAKALAPPALAEASVTRDDVLLYIVRYRRDGGPAGVVLELRWMDGSLVAVSPAGDIRRLAPVGEGTFANLEPPASVIVFDRDGSGLTAISYDLRSVSRFLR